MLQALGRDNLTAKVQIALQEVMFKELKMASTIIVSASHHL